MPCMNDKKKKAHPQLCMSPSRRLILQSRNIRRNEIPGRAKCSTGSFSTPSASTSHFCGCNQEYCEPESCGTPAPPPPACCGPQKRQTKPQTCKKFEKEKLDDIACCQEMLRKLTEDFLADDQDKKGCCIQEPPKPKSCKSPCCAENDPLPTTASCLSKSYPQTPTPKKSSIMACPGCPKPPVPEPDTGYKPVEEACSMDSCARDVPSKTNDNCPENCEDDGQAPELQTSICNYEQSRTMPFVSPIPSGHGSSTIAKKSNEKLEAKLNDKPDKKSKKKEDKKKKDDKPKKECQQNCSHRKCVANQACICRFPPALSQYFKCTGQMSGNCSCDKNQ